jgi:hypothetical protein
MKLVGLIKMCLNETYNRVWVGKHTSDMFPMKNGLKKGEALSPLLFNFASEYAIIRVLANQQSLKLNITRQLLGTMMMLIYWVEGFVL